jgi:lincosamide nucleotidyltransferase A/C/D/E
MMSARDVVAVLEQLEAVGVQTCIDGGWGVDALLRRQTRQHDDLDLVVRRADESRVLTALAALGFSHAREVEPGLPARLVLRDPGDRRVDLHLVLFDEAGNGWQQLSDHAWALYPAAGLCGTGQVKDKVVTCLTADLQLCHHLGYAWDDHDAHDVQLLAERYSVPVPPPLWPIKLDTH